MLEAKRVDIPSPHGIVDCSEHIGEVHGGEDAEERAGKGFELRQIAAQSFSRIGCGND